MSALEWLDTVERDVRFAARSMRRAPGFTAIIALSLALGIGINASIYSLIDAVLDRRLPVRNPDGLVIVGDPGGSIRADTARPTACSSRIRCTSTSAIMPARSTDSPRSENPDASTLSPDEKATELEHPARTPRVRQLFRRCSAWAPRRANVGRGGGRAGAPAQATISYDYWMRRFGKEPASSGATC